MRLFIGGMRGSRPVTGCAFEEFGGDTTSLLLVGSRGERLVLDAGTGMQAVAGQLVDLGPGDVTVLFSHYHLDHMAGLTMNPLFYQSDWSFRFVGPTFADGGVRDAVMRLLSPPYWPVTLSKMIARFEFVEIEDVGCVPRTISAAAGGTGAWYAPYKLLGRLCVRGCQVPHPGGCLAYRIDDIDTGAALVFATDIEWRNRTATHEAAFMAMCREPGPADVLAMDAHFARENEAAFAGWGHSSWQDCLDIAESAGIRQVLLGHHAPDADDKALRAREQQVKKRLSGGALTRAGQWLTIGG